MNWLKLDVNRTNERRCLRGNNVLFEWSDGSKPTIENEHA